MCRNGHHFCKSCLRRSDIDNYAPDDCITVVRSGPGGVGDDSGDHVESVVEVSFEPPELLSSADDDRDDDAEVSTTRTMTVRPGCVETTTEVRRRIRYPRRLRRYVQCLINPQNSHV